MIVMISIISSFTYLWSGRRQGGGDLRGQSRIYVVIPLSYSDNVDKNFWVGKCVGATPPPPLLLNFQGWRSIEAFRHP